MTPITDDFRVVLLRDLDGLQREVAMFPDDTSLWRTSGGVTNSAGNLAVHVAGNLQYFVGHVLGGRPYQRDREAEFGRKTGSRDEVIEELRRAVAAVNETLPGVTAERLDASFDAHPGVQVSTRRFLLHLCTHTSFHLGQVGYLRRIMNDDSRSTNAVNAGRLASA